MINGVVRRRNRAVAAGAQRFELIVNVNFFAGLQSRQQVLILVFFKLAAIQVDAIFRINPIAVRGQQPVHAVRAAAFFIGGQRQNQIAVRNITFLFQADKTGDQQGVAGLHVFRAAAVEIAVLLKKNKRIDGPVLAACFHYIQVSDEQDRLARAAAVIANDQILFVFAWARDLYVFFFESSFTQSLCHGLGGAGHIAHGIG